MTSTARRYGGPVIDNFSLGLTHGLLLLLAWRLLSRADLDREDPPLTEEKKPRGFGVKRGRGA